MIDVELSAREKEVLNEAHEVWFQPMDVGGRSHSHHSATLCRLVRRGLIESRQRTNGVRGSKTYRITAAGKAVREAG